MRVSLSVCPPSMLASWGSVATTKRVAALARFLFTATPNFTFSRKNEEKKLVLVLQLKDLYKHKK